LAWTIEFSKTAERDLRKLDKQAARRISRFLLDRIAALDDPRSVGEALHGSELGEFWKYRVGDYRIIARIEDDVIRIMILEIGHRREIYR
jgi:mRNA interferase RelE/StbE